MKTLPFDQKVQDMVLNAEGKALGTYGSHGINVISVSTVDIEDEKVILVDYFMNKTKENFLENPEVSLSCWKALSGYQIKGTVEYITAGEKFDEIVAWAKDEHPDRTVHGYLVLTPKEIHDISATVQ